MTILIWFLCYLGAVCLVSVALGWFLHAAGELG